MSRILHFSNLLTRTSTLLTQVPLPSDPPDILLYSTYRICLFVHYHCHYYCKSLGFPRSLGFPFDLDYSPFHGIETWMPVTLLLIIVSQKKKKHSHASYLQHLQYDEYQHSVRSTVGQYVSFLFGWLSQ